MAIQKQSATVLRKVDIPYSVFPTTVITQIRNTDALAVWTYLLSKNEGWIIRMQDIQNHFGIGRDKARNAVKYLEDMELVWREQKKSDKGHILDNFIVCSSVPKSLVQALEKLRPPENPLLGEADRLKNRPPEKPTVGKSVPLIKDQLSNKGSIDKKAQGEDFSCLDLNPEIKKILIPSDMYALKKGKLPPLLAKRMTDGQISLVKEHFGIN